MDQRKIDWVGVTAEASDMRGSANIVKLHIPNLAGEEFTPEEARVVAQKWLDAADEAEKNLKVHIMEAADIRRKAGKPFMCKDCDWVYYAEHLVPLHLNDYPTHEITEDPEEAWRPTRD